ncbi:hypothetical protein J4454_03945 [Candidatus Pacearchaeota archaeon]|nr:hypothetical protein [Candidatus Pacearchaeota archaeon]
MRKNNIEGLVAYGKDDDSDGDMIETNLSDEEVSKVEAGMKIQSELADIKYHLRSPRKSYRGTGKVNKYSGRGNRAGERKRGRKNKEDEKKNSRYRRSRLHRLASG